MKSAMVVLLMLLYLNVFGQIVQKGNVFFSAGVSTSDLIIRNHHTENTYFDIATSLITVNANVCSFISYDIAVGGEAEMLSFDYGNLGRAVSVNTGPFLRYYWYLSKGVFWLGEASLKSTIYISPGHKPEYGWSYGAGPGIEIFLNQKVAVDFLIKYNRSSAEMKIPNENRLEINSVANVTFKIGCTIFIK